MLISQTIMIVLITYRTGVLDLFGRHLFVSTVFMLLISTSDCTNVTNAAPYTPPAMRLSVVDEVGRRITSEDDLKRGDRVRFQLSLDTTGGC